MKTIASFLFILAFAVCPMAQPASLNETLQKGLVEEETNRNLSNAINAYQDVLRQYDAQHQAAATAAFRLAECYAKLGRTNDAITLFRRVATEFAGQTSLAALSRQRLADLGATGTPTVDRALLPPTDRRQLELLDQEVQLIQRQITSINNMIGVGRASSEDLIPPQRNMLELQRKMAEIEGHVRLDLLAAPPTNASASAAPAKPTPVDPETKEIERWTKTLAESPDLVNQNQGEPLRQAASRGQLKLAEFLLDHGADISLGSREQTALAAAVRAKNLEMTQFLLKKGAPVKITGTVETPDTYPVPQSFPPLPPLCWAAYQGWLAGANILLEAGASPDVRIKPNWTPLHLATWAGNLEVVKLLLAKGAEINCQDDNGTTPLLIAIQKNFNQIAEYLLSEKADAHATGDPANTVAGLFSYFNPETPFNRGVPSNYPGSARIPPIFLALRYYPTMVEPLLQHGAALTETNKAGQSFLEWCAVEGDLQSLKNNIKRFSDETRGKALLATLQKSRATMDVIQIFEDSGVDVNVRDEDGYTLVHCAALAGNEALVQFLVQHGADINATNNSGYTPLDICKDQRVDPNLQQKFLARRLGQPPPPTEFRQLMLDLLIRLGAKHSSKFEQWQKENPTNAGIAQPNALFRAAQPATPTAPPRSNTQP